MESKKSIRNVSSSKSNIISDMIEEKPKLKKEIKKEKAFSDISSTIDTYTPREIDLESGSVSVGGKKGGNVKKLFQLFSNIKPIYTVSLFLIIILLAALLLIPGPAAKDPVEQAKIEAEMVKKELSKHMVLPEDEQIDIRKITSKLEDPFFQNAEIGDYLIIMYKNRIAYIYSVNKNLIINAGVVFIDPKTATTTNSTSTQ
jgi:hypothetical protein